MRFYPESGTVKFYPEKYFSSYLCNTLLTDKDNNLWVATDRGLFRQDITRSHVQLASIPHILEDSFPGIRIHSVFASRNKVYAGTRAGGGLLIYDKDSMRFEKQFLFRKELSGFPVYKISAIDPTTLLLGTGKPLLQYNELTGKETRLTPPDWTEDDWINDLYLDSKGNTWISSNNIYRYNNASRQFTLIPGSRSMPAIPVAFAEDRPGNIWIAGHGLARYNTALQIFDVQIDSFPFIKMPDKQITAMVIDKQNTIWFSTLNNGLIGYDINTKTFRHITSHEGLPDDNIASLIVVGPRLWIACYSGIASMDLQSLQIKRFGKDEGFPQMPVLRGSKFFYDTAQQQLYLGFYNVIARFNPY
jgi:ligand-binding sensor domain-containing protein